MNEEDVVSPPIQDPTLGENSVPISNSFAAISGLGQNTSQELVYHLGLLPDGEITEFTILFTDVTNATLVNDS